MHGPWVCLRQVYILYSLTSFTYLSCNIGHFCTRHYLLALLTHALSKCLPHNHIKSGLVHRAGLDFEIVFHYWWMHHILSIVHSLSSVCLNILSDKTTLPTSSSSKSYKSNQLSWRCPLQFLSETLPAMTNWKGCQGLISHALLELNPSKPLWLVTLQWKKRTHIEKLPRMTQIIKVICRQ